MTAADRQRPWTEDEIACVLRHYGPMTARQLAQRIGRSPQAVKSFVYRNGYARPAVKREVTRPRITQTAAQSRNDRQLTAEQVLFVREVRAKRGRPWRTSEDTTPTMESLAKQYGVAPRVLRMAAAGDTYKWVA